MRTSLKCWLAGLALAPTVKLSCASSGNGTTTHIGAKLLFRNLTKAD